MVGFGLAVAGLGLRSQDERSGEPARVPEPATPEPPAEPPAPERRAAGASRSGPASPSRGPEPARPDPARARKRDPAGAGEEPGSDTGPGPTPPSEVLQALSLAGDSHGPSVAALASKGLGVVPGAVPPLPLDPGAQPAAGGPDRERSPARPVRERVAPRLFTRPPVDLRNTPGGVRIARVGPAAHEAGLRAGDRLLRVNGERVLSAAQARSMLRGRRGTTLGLVVGRHGERHAIRLRRPNRLSP